MARRFSVFAAIVTLVVSLLQAQPAQAFEPGKTGIVVLHGKWGNPGNFIAKYVATLRQAGFVVEAPETAWSGRRHYDMDYTKALAEVGQALASLKSKGVDHLVLAGHSMGAGAALAYAARNTTGPEVDALILLAPGHTPEWGKQRDLLADAVAKANELVALGKGGETVEFRDLNVGRSAETTLPANVFLSFFGPQGPAVMPINAALVKKPLPVLWLVGAFDTVTKPASYAFDKLPANPASRYQSVEADHLGTVPASAPIVVEWLKGL